MALPINIDELLTGETVEWDRVEFKKDWNPKKVMHTICAFANDISNWGGGYLFIGVDEENGLPILPPKGLNPNRLDAIQKELVSLSHKLSPHYFPVVQPYITEGHHILVIWVPGGDNRPYKAPVDLARQSEKEYYVRRNSTTKKASRADLEILKEIAQRIPFDDRINHQADIEDLNFGIIREYLETVKSDLRHHLSQLSLKDLAKQIQLLSGSPEDLHPKNVALLMFHEKPSLFFRGAYTDIVIYTDKAGKNFTEKRFEGAIHHQMMKVLDYFKTNIIEEKVVKTPSVAQADRFWNYPFDAIEEAVANAFYHRSYENQNPIEISVFPDKIQILSFPGPLPPITQETLKQKKIISRDYRNRRIGDFFKELKLTEGRATGFPTIYDSMEENGSPEPIFETDKDFTYFLTTFSIHPDFIKSEKEQAMDDGTISKKSLQILRFCLKPQSRTDILNEINLKNHPDNYKRHVEPLILMGLLNLKYPESVSSPRQKYVTTKKGKSYIKSNEER